MPGNSEESIDGVVWAAGTLLWRDSPEGRLLAIIHRRKHKDWTLPKGKVEPGETSKKAAERETEEETGCTVKMSGFAGCCSYSYGSEQKLVLYWNAEFVTEDKSKDKVEVDELRWESADSALLLLDHKSERDLVSSVSGTPIRDVCGGLGLWKTKTRYLYKLNRYCSAPYRRVAEAIQIQHANYTKDAAESTRRGKENGANFSLETSWIEPTLRLVACADDCLRRGEVEAGWRFLGDAERNAVVRYQQGRFDAEVKSLVIEADEKLYGWRKLAAEAILDSHETLYRHYPGDVGRLRKVMLHLQERHGNIHAKRSGTQYQIAVLATIISLAVLLLILLLPSLNTSVAALSALRAITAEGGTSQVNGLGIVSKQLLFVIALFGILGASFSGMRSIIAKRLSGGRIDRSITMWVTLTRPIIGGAAAIATFVVLRAGFLGMTESTSLWTVLAVAFASGFSEQLVVKAVDQVVKKSSDAE